jgi:hypothetical protein
MKYFLSLSLVFTVSFSASAQLGSLENLEESTRRGFFKTYISSFLKDFTQYGDPFALSGGVGLNMRSYNAFGGPLRQDPFFYTLNTNLNVRIYNIDLPFSMVLTAKNQQSSYPKLREIRDAFSDKITSLNQRFVRFGMSPHYKWAKLHLGHRAMSFSKYTLDNLNFNGIGTELTPGKVRVAAMYGQLARAEPVDLSLVTPNVPVYQRHGWGTKLGYGDDQSSVDFTVFKAQDNVHSIIIPANNPVQPTAEENMVWSIQAQKLFLEKFRFKLEYASSTVSPNALDATSENQKFTKFLIMERTTTEHSSAIDASMAYEGKAMIAGIQYRRVDPNYRTLGAYFFNRDIVDVLGNLAFNLLDNHMTVALSGGVQANNLDQTKPATTRRFIYSANVGYAKNAFSGSFNFNNNTTDVGYVLNQNLDSLNAVVITQDIGVNLNYNLPGSGGTKQAISLSANLQNVNDDVVARDQSSDSKVGVLHLGYTVMTSNQWRFSSRINYNQNEIAQMQIKRYGAGLGIGKSFLDNKMSVGLDANYFINTRENNSKSNNLLGQLMLGYELGSGLTTQLNWGFLRTTAETINAFSESTVTLGLQYNFNYKPSRKSDKLPK